MKIGKTRAVVANNIQNAAIKGAKYADKLIDKHSDDSFLSSNKSDKAKALKCLHTMFVEITPDDVAVIEKADNKDAAEYCFNLICKSMKIPEEIAPEFNVKPLDEEVPGICGLYGFMDNRLYYYSESKTNTKLGKWWTFGLLRHEMEHFRQNMDMLRSKDLSSELFNYYETLYKEAGLSKERFTTFINELKDFQKSVLKYYPEIKKGSREYKHARKFLASQTNYTLGTNGLIDRLHYFIQPTEFEACRTQGFNWINYMCTKIRSNLGGD